MPLKSTLGIFPTETNPVTLRKASRSKLNRSPRGKQFIKIKIFHRSFLLKSFRAVNNLQFFSSWSGTFCLPNKIFKKKKKAKAHECQETLGARHLPRHQAGSWQRKPARGPILTGRIFQSRRRDRNRHPLENRRPGPRPPSPPTHPGPGELDPSPALTIAAGRAAAASPRGRAGLRADAKFKPRRRCEEAARGIVGWARPRSTMGGSAAPSALRPGYSGCCAAGPGRAAAGGEPGRRARRVRGEPDH